MPVVPKFAGLNYLYYSLQYWHTCSLAENTAVSVFWSDLYFWKQKITRDDWCGTRYPHFSLACKNIRQIGKQPES